MVPRKLRQWVLEALHVGHLSIIKWRYWLIATCGGQIWMRPSQCGLNHAIPAKNQGQHHQPPQPKCGRSPEHHCQGYILTWQDLSMARLLWSWLVHSQSDLRWCSCCSPPLRPSFEVCGDYLQPTGYHMCWCPTTGFNLPLPALRGYWWAKGSAMLWRPLSTHPATVKQSECFIQPRRLWQGWAQEIGTSGWWNSCLSNTTPPMLHLQSSLDWLYLDFTTVEPADCSNPPQTFAYLYKQLCNN